MTSAAPRRLVRWLTFGGSLAGGALILSCAGSARPLTPPVPVAPPEEITWTVFLIGDAGKPAHDDQVLRALTAQASRAPDRSTVLFLGDNLYPGGLPDTSSPFRGEMERRLAVQVDAILTSGARGIFIPGNHDWADHSADGWPAIIRQERFVVERGKGTVDFLPGGGCPGPVVRDVGPVFRLVLLDTQWWLHEHGKPADPGSSCPADSDAEVADLLQTALVGAGQRKVLVAGHHPLASGGTHGGKFTFTQHLFPLVEFKSWLWIPFPLIGSLYPAARAMGISRQDIPNSRNREMREAIEAAMAGIRPLAYVAGHEHSLQVLEGASADWLLVSGGGYFDHTTHIGWIKETRYAEARSGFMRVDALASGRVRLGVVTVNEDGSSQERFSQWLVEVP